MHGSGKMTWATGENYTGDFKNGEISGYGIYKYPGGGAVRGNFVNGRLEGEAQVH